ncbi:DUF222 domain-containing protein, partial [Haloechinothrix sp. LS1_15]|uniref:HNH endonuclease signature motif containing protein n=1 Tax=Haloechinothrix sp. LS1_15 TaxID=2652248 RepID=UPI002947493A
GTPDTRPPEQRQGDAFAAMVGLVLDEGKLPAEGGEKPRLVITFPLRELCADGLPASTALLNRELPLSAEQARRYACDAGVIPAVLGGRGQRTVSTTQRRALALRDGGCVFPGCTRPERRCQAHHIHHRADGGPTNLDNPALLCGHHHRLIHHSEWDIHMGADGHPTCIPPPWLASHIPKQRTPRNATRDLTPV